MMETIFEYRVELRALADVALLAFVYLAFVRIIRLERRMDNASDSINWLAREKQRLGRS